MNKSDKNIKAVLLYRIKSRLLILYLLNVIDIIFTIFLVHTGYFIEVNIVMRYILASPSISVLVKTIVPVILIIFVWKRIAAASLKQLLITNNVVFFSVIIYLLIILSHIFWLCCLLYQGLI